MATAPDGAPQPFSTWARSVLGHSAGVAVLYLAGQIGFVITGWGPVGYLPPLLYGLYLITASPITTLWTCPECERRTVAPRCRACERRLLDRATATRVVGTFVLVVPAGAAVAEFLLLFPLGAVLPLLDAISVLSPLHRALTGLFGFVGPVPFFLYTTATAMVAAVAAIGFHTLAVLGRSALPVEG